MPASVGRFEGTASRPTAWKAEYPNPAFRNMRPEDAFWGARLVARFTRDDIAAIVGKGEYSDPTATAYVTQVLVERQRKVLATWLNGVTPLVEPTIADGVLQAENAAITAGVADAPKRYTAQWFAWDNAAGTRAPSVPWSRSPVQATLTLPLPAALARTGRRRVHWHHGHRRASGPSGLGGASGDLLVPTDRRWLGTGGIARGAASGAVRTTQEAR